MSDDDLIRRGDALKAADEELRRYGFSAPEGRRYDMRDAIAALPAVTVGVICTWPSCGHTAKGQCNPSAHLAALEPVAAPEHVNETPKTEHDAGNVLTPAPDAAAIREAALMTVPDEIELYYIIKASGAKKRIDVARAVSTHLEPMRRAILALITEKPHDR